MGELKRGVLIQLIICMKIIGKHKVFQIFPMISQRIIGKPKVFPIFHFFKLFRDFQGQEGPKSKNNLKNQVHLKNQLFQLVEHQQLLVLLQQLKNYSKRLNKKELKKKTPYNIRSTNEAITQNSYGHDTSLWRR